MKKKEIKSLKLNKKSISNLSREELTGGKVVPTGSVCVTGCVTVTCHCFSDECGALTALGLC